MKNDRRRLDFLALFDPDPNLGIRGTVGNLFYDQVKRGISQKPTDICRMVMEEIRASRASGYRSRPREALWPAMLAHHDLALAYADWWIEYESLTPEERDMARGGSDGGTNVTEPQRRTLESMGIAVPPTRREASDLIGTRMAAGRK